MLPTSSPLPEGAGRAPHPNNQPDRCNIKIYLLSILMGLLVGVIYGLAGVRSPAPPIVALLGLLGILAGEQVVAFAKRAVEGHAVTGDWWRGHAAPHALGQLPPQPDPRAAPAPKGQRT